MGPCESLWSQVMDHILSIKYEADANTAKVHHGLLCTNCVHQYVLTPAAVWHQVVLKMCAYAACRASWWSVDAPMPTPEPLINPLLERTITILLTVLKLQLPAAWKSLQLSVVMLWNAAVQSGDAHAVKKHD